MDTKEKRLDELKKVKMEVLESIKGNFSDKAYIQMRASIIESYDNSVKIVEDNFMKKEIYEIHKMISEMYEKEIKEQKE